MNNFKPGNILEPWDGRRRRPDMYTDIPVTVLQVPVGEEGGNGGLPSLLKGRSALIYTATKILDFCPNQLDAP